ncbi:hypothetical protein MMC30_002371 [Trapelia coarctata]|nr:hypothetical protein [Trapelia coarctata]
MSLPGEYPQLSALMGLHEGMAIFRKFAVLNARNLAYMQAEILLIESELNYLARRDATRARDEKNFSKQLWQLHGTEDCAQWERILESRMKLKEYNEALALLAQVNKLDKANDCDLSILRKWLVLAGGDGFPYGVEAQAYNDDATSDLVAVLT